MAAGLGEGRRNGSGCGGLSGHGGHGGRSRCGECSSRLFPIQTSPLISGFAFNIPLPLGTTLRLRVLRSTLLIPLTLRPLSQRSLARPAYKFLPIRSQVAGLTSLPVVVVIFPIASPAPPRAPICAVPTRGSRDFPFACKFPSSAYLPSILFSTSRDHEVFGIFASFPAQTSSQSTICVLVPTRR